MRRADLRALQHIAGAEQGSLPSTRRSLHGMEGSALVSAMLDLFADFEPAPAPIAAPRQPEAPEPQPAGTKCKPPEPDAWAYIHPAGTPAHLMAFACLCGARDERPAPSLDNVRCWQCGQVEGMRPRPWRATSEEWARFA